MNERIKRLATLAGGEFYEGFLGSPNSINFKEDKFQKFAELIVEEMHRKVISSILITDVLMEEKGQKPTSEDYIRALNKDFGVEK